MNTQVPKLSRQGIGLGVSIEEVYGMVCVLVGMGVCACMRACVRACMHECMRVCVRAWA